jgi:TPR repeat protein
MYTRAVANQLEAGLAYLRKSQDTNARNLLKPLAEQGVPEAQNALGWMYEQERGVYRNFLTAEIWYRLAIEQGYGPARENLGAMQERIEREFQKGMEAFQARDYAKAYKLWGDLASQGQHPAAQTNLGFLYTHNLGVARDYDAARRWYKRAIEQGYRPAQENLEALEEKIRAQQQAEERLRAQRRQIDSATVMMGIAGVVIWTSIMRPVSMQSVAETVSGAASVVRAFAQLWDAGLQVAAMRQKTIEMFGGGSYTGSGKRN